MNNDPATDERPRSNRKWLGIGVASALLLGYLMWWQPTGLEVSHFFDGAPEGAMTTASPATTVATPATTPSNPQLREPDLNAREGEACDLPGALGLEGSMPLLCSETTIAGEPLPNPMWRPTTSGLPPTILSAREQAAVDFVKQNADTLRTSGDQAILLMIDEYANAAELASSSGISPEDAMVSLVRGLQESNSLSLTEALDTTSALLAGVMQLHPNEPAGDYSYQMLSWLVDETGD